MSASRGTRARRRSRGSKTGFERGPIGGRFFVLVSIFTLAAAAAGILEGPKFARQVWSLIGVRRVEARAEELRAAGAESGVDPCVLAGVMYVESRGEIDAVSGKGARGLFQLLPAAAGDAARRLGLPPPTEEDLVREPLLNTRLGAAHLAWLIRTDGPDLERVLVGYNAGRAKLARWEKDAGGWPAWKAQQEQRDTTGALTYARDVLDFTRRFRDRGNVVPIAMPAPETPAEVPAAGSPAPSEPR